MVDRGQVTGNAPGTAPGKPEGTPEGAPGGTPTGNPQGTPRCWCGVWWRVFWGWLGVIQELFGVELAMFWRGDICSFGAPGGSLGGTPGCPGTFTVQPAVNRTVPCDFTLLTRIPIKPAESGITSKLFLLPCFWRLQDDNQNAFSRQWIGIGHGRKTFKIQIFG